MKQCAEKRENGAALIALLALMTLLAIFMLGVAPSIVQEVQRQKELESIRRGEEIARAIELYFQAKRQLPKSMDELLEGLPRGTKKLQILRESAAKDPLSESGEWKLIQPNDKIVVDFQRKVMDFNSGATPPSNRIFQPFLVQIVNTLNTETTEDTDPPGGEDDSPNIEAPFIGVISRSQRKSVLTYYGIERHDRWMFTPLFRGTAQNSGGIGAGGGQAPPPPPAPPPR
jgi:type II secretory pathway pseudopilin PulG